MSFRIYRGGLDSDMVSSCFDEMENDKLSRHIVIIPEHYSYEMERMAVDKFGVIGINNIDVFTPHRMAVNYLSTDTESYLNPAGKQMLVVCAIDECLENDDLPDNIRVIIGRKSFVGNIVSLISEFKRHMITPELLRECVKAQLEEKKGVGHEHLAEKFIAAAAVYERYDKLLSEKKYIDSDDDLKRLAAKITRDIPKAIEIKKYYDEINPKLDAIRKLTKEIKQIYDDNGDIVKLSDKIEKLEKEKLEKEKELINEENKRESLLSVQPDNPEEKKNLTKEKSAATRKINAIKKDIQGIDEEIGEINERTKNFRESLGDKPQKLEKLKKDAAEKKAMLDGKHLLIDTNTRVWFMCFDEYMPHHMCLLQAVIEAAKETTVCLNYIKYSDVYELTEKEKAYREADRLFGSLIGSSERKFLYESAKKIYEKYGVYYDETVQRPKNNINNDAQIYDFVRKSYDKLKALRPLEEKFFSRSDCVNRNTDIDFFVKNFGFLKRYKGNAKNIDIAECENPHREIEFAAEKIHTLVRESDLKYKTACSNSKYNECMDAAENEVSKLFEKIKKRLKKFSPEDFTKLKDWIGIKGARKPKESDVVRYRDIGILFGNAEDYTHILDAVFAEHGIQYFADEKIILSEHPIAVQMLSVFDIYSSDWSYEAMFRYLNAGFVFVKDESGRVKRLSSGEIARLDNYVVRYNLRGRNIWNKEWEFYGEVFGMTWDDDEKLKSDEEENARVNEIRQIICKPLEKLLPISASEKRKASEYIDSLYEFLRDIYIFEGLNDDVKRFENDSKSPASTQTAQQFSQIWNKLLEIMNQIKVTMGDVEISFKHFGEYLKAGMSQCEIRTIPSSLDGVYTGTVERSTSKPIKNLFVMGAVNGTYPTPATYDGFFSDIDRSYIRNFKNGEIELAPTKSEQRIKQRYKMYKAMRTASQSILLTYPSQDNEGKTVKKSAFVADIKDMFGINEHSAFPENEADEANITSEFAAKRGLVINSAAPMSRLSPVWRSVYRSLRNGGRYDDTLEQIASAAAFYSRPIKLMPETAQKLYTQQIMRNGENIGERGRSYSATKLNTYSDCPMKYFMQYGLKLAEDVKSGVQANEVGTYVHKLVKTVCDSVYIRDENLSNAENARRCLDAWHSLTEEMLDKFIDENIEKTENNLTKHIADYHMRKKVVHHIRKAVTKSSNNVLKSLNQGSFVLKDTELPIDNVRLYDDEDIYIRGAVDRVDEFRYDNGREIENLLRIIDYKTGMTQYNEGNVLNGREMQLIIYAIAAALKYEHEDTGSKYSLSGIYYQHIRDGYQNAKDEAEGLGKSTFEAYLDGNLYLPPDDGTEKERRKRTAILNAFGNESMYANYKITSKGKNGKNVKSEEERDCLINAVKKNIRGIDREIMSGKILPMPFEESKTQDACTYCRFKDICSFEEDKTKRKKNDGGANFGGEL